MISMNDSEPTLDIRETARTMVKLIRRFVDGSAGPYEWDDFMGVPFKNKLLEAARLRAEHIMNDAPPSRATPDDAIARELLEVAREIESDLCKADPASEC